MKKVKVLHEDLFRAIATTIAAQDRVTLAINRTKHEPAFFYTIGNQEKRLPELLVIGNFDPNDMCALLNKLSEIMIANPNGPFSDRHLVGVGGEHPLLIYKAHEDAKKNYTIQAGQFYGNEDYDVMQVILPDKSGNYPPDPKCHKDFQVPVLRAAK